MGARVRVGSGSRDNWTPDGKPKNDQRFLAEYAAMVDHFVSLPTQPLVFLVLPTAVGVVPVGVLINGTVIRDEEIPLIKQLAAQKGLPTIDANTPTTNHPEYFMVDNIHPNDAGYVVLAQIIYSGLIGTTYVPPIAAADAGRADVASGHDGGARD